MTRADLIAATVIALANLPTRALASSGSGSEAAWGDPGALGLAGVAAALAWHHVSRRRATIVRRWQQMHVGDRLPILRLGERLHALHLRQALASALHLRSEARGVPSPDHPRRVLIVDDDADLRSAVGEILSSEGFVVSEAADGFEALRRARDERPDVILLDLMMPRMDGFAFRAAQQADAAIASIPVVVISASGQEQERSFGAAAYLHKPCDLRVLLNAVNRHAVAAV